MGNLLAPAKLIFKPNDRIYLEAFTKSGMQARTINSPLVTTKALECMGLLPFAYGLDNRYWDGSHVNIDELAITYMKNRKFGLNNPETAAPTYKGDMLASSVEKIALKVSCGNTDGESDNSSRRIGYKLTFNLEWDDFVGEQNFHPVDALWLGCIDYWDKQLVEECQVVQLSLLEEGEDLVKEMDKVLGDNVRTVAFGDTVSEPIDTAAYIYPEDQLEGKRGLLTGGALEARKLSLIRKGIAVPKNDKFDPRPFGFDPSP